MHLAKILLPLGLVLLLAGCDAPDQVVGSVHPLFSESDPVFEPALVDAWVKNGGEGRGDEGSLRFEKRGDDGYQLIVTDRGGEEQARYESVLLRLGEHFFLDYVPEKLQVNSVSCKLRLLRSPRENEFAPHLLYVGDQALLEFLPIEHSAGRESCQVHFLKAHWFLKVSHEGDVLRLAVLDPVWLQKMLAEEQVQLDHEPVDEGQHNFALTASTRDLQEFVLAHANDDDAFPETMEWIRRE